MTESETAHAVPGRPSARFRPPADGRSPRARKVSVALQLMHRVLGLEHLHFGLWEADDPRTIEGLRRAQERYAERLVERIPAGTRSILDVGAGVGTLARRLVARGYEVEGLSPDPYQARVFAERVGRPFHLGRFQEFEPGAPYDLVLMSESSQYIWIDSLLPAVRRAAPGGWLLVADYFVTARDETPLGRTGHPIGELLAAAEAGGFRLDLREDVTDAVLPTLELAQDWVARYVEPTVEIFTAAARERHPLLHRAGHWLFGRRIERLNAQRELLDPAAFARCKRYELLRFRVP